MVIKKLFNYLNSKPTYFFLRNVFQQHYICPICDYRGPFRKIERSTGLRLHAKCPSCNSSEKNRMQYLLINQLLYCINPHNKKALHFAPEKILVDLFKKNFKSYETADLLMKDVDHKVNLLNLPFDNGSYDFIFASHVLEHIKDDTSAINEIYRILTHDGVAILPVPIIANKTVEYDSANPFEANHVRAPGIDYYDKLKTVFRKVIIITSDDYSKIFQPYIFENRQIWPTDKCPHRPSMTGEFHIDAIPLCIK